MSGAKLSKHLLQMKFMQKTAIKIELEQHDQEQQQQIDDDHWVLDIPDMKEPESNYEIEASCVPCENLKWGRFSFKGFNPEIEKLMVIKNNENLDDNLNEENEKSVGDKEMANRYKSLIGTIGKKFATKRKRHEVEDSSDGGESEPEERKTSPPKSKVDNSKSFDKTKKGKMHRFMKPGRD